MLLVPAQRRRAAALPDAVVLEVHVRQVHERLQVQPLPFHAVTRFREQLLGARAVLRRVTVRLHSVVHRPFGVDAVPGVARTAAQRQRTELLVAVRRQVVVVAVRLRPVPAVQRGAGVTGRYPQPPVVRNRRVQPDQHPVGRGLVTRGVGVARRVVPRPQQLRPGAALVRLDGRRTRQPFRLTQTPVQRLTQVAAVVHQRRRDVRMDLPRQLTERLPCLARRAAVENALVDRVARRQRIRRRRDRPLVRRLRHAGEARAVAPDAQRHSGRLVAQPGAEEQVVRCHRIKLPAHPLLRRQDGVLLAQQAAHLALRQQIGTVLQRHRHLAAADRRRAAALDPIALAVRAHFHRVARPRLEADVAGHVQGADRVARRHGAATSCGQ